LNGTGEKSLGAGTYTIRKEKGLTESIRKEGKIGRMSGCGINCALLEKDTGDLNE